MNKENTHGLLFDLPVTHRFGTQVDKLWISEKVDEAMNDSTRVDVICHEQVKKDIISKQPASTK